MMLGREFYFDAAHFLPDYKGNCEKLHGHTYKLEVVIADEIKKDGMVIDFRHIKEVVNPKIIEKLDHTNLNEVIDNPTAENIVEWIWNKLEKELPVYTIKLWEGNGKWVAKTRD